MSGEFSKASYRSTARIRASGMNGLRDYVRWTRSPISYATIHLALPPQRNLHDSPITAHRLQPRHHAYGSDHTAVQQADARWRKADGSVGEPYERRSRRAAFAQRGADVLGHVGTNGATYRAGRVRLPARLRHHGTVLC